MPLRSMFRAVEATTAISGGHYLNSQSASGIPIPTRHTKKKHHGLPLSYLITRLDRKYEATLLSIDLVYYIPFVIIFVIFFLWSRPSDTYFMTQSSIDLLQENDFAVDCITKNFDDIRNQEDFFNWLQLIAEPVLWNSTLEMKQDDGRVVRYFGGQNHLLGSLRIRTQRTRNTSCELNEEMFDDIELPCWAPVNPRSESRNEELFGATYERCSEVDGISTTGRVHRYHCGGYIWDVPFTWSNKQATEFIANITKLPMTDPQATRFVMLEFFSYNAYHDAFLSTKLHIEVLAGGNWWPDVQYQVFQIWTSKQWPWTIVGFVFLLYTMYFVYRFNSDVMQATARAQAKGEGVFMAVVKHILHLFNLLELVNLLTLIVVFILYFIWWWGSVKLPDETKFFPFESAYPGKLDFVLFVYQWQIYLNALNTILCFLKFLKYVKFISHLNVISATLVAVAGEIYGVLTLLMALLVAYTIAGKTLFGNTMWEFRSLAISINTLLRVLVGDFDYSSIREQNRHLAALFFWSFMILGLFLLLNFIIAVITDGFSKVQQQNNSTSLGSQMGKLVKAMHVTRARDVPALLWNSMRRSRAETYLVIIATLAHEKRRRDEYTTILEEKIRNSRQAWRNRKCVAKSINITCSPLLSYLRETPLADMTVEGWEAKVEVVDWATVQEWDFNELEKALQMLYVHHWVELLTSEKFMAQHTFEETEVCEWWEEIKEQHGIDSDAVEEDDAAQSRMIQGAIRTFVEKFYQPRVERLEDAVLSLNEQIERQQQQIMQQQKQTAQTLDDIMTVVSRVSSEQQTFMADMQRHKEDQRRLATLVHHYGQGGVMGVPPHPPLPPPPAFAPAEMVFPQGAVPQMVSSPNRRFSAGDIRNRAKISATQKVNQQRQAHKKKDEHDPSEGHN
eukprot:TRINITY_DN60898_c0_g1_i1.p1 TRINITY_DN60898_c0_g1~~TRINITY_DN60898_c0_g1_i1.p1  ORF type:complete len:903 (+),score=67.70 TRINITY_DN60898_c0_g1_i1:28-2736(+)